MCAALARTCPVRRFPARGFFETKKATVSRGLSAVLTPSGSFEVAFQADAVQLEDVLGTASVLQVDVAAIDECAAQFQDNILARRCSALALHNVTDILAHQAADSLGLRPQDAHTLPCFACHFATVFSLMRYLQVSG
jgi:hypothetical protein